MTVPTTEMAVVEADDIASIAEDVWSSFLSLYLDDADEADELSADDALTGSIAVSGEWHGTVYVELSADHAVAAAEAMFQADAGSLTAGEVRDALGELTNMVGGNIKSLLPAPSRLSLPQVTDGTAAGVRDGSQTLVDEMTMVCDAGPVRISIYQA